MSIPGTETYSNLFAHLVEECFAHNDFRAAFTFEGESLALFCWHMRRYLATHNINYQQFMTMRGLKLPIMSVIKGTDPQLIWALLEEDPNNEAALSQFLGCPLAFMQDLVNQTKNILLLCRLVDKLIAQPDRFPNRARFLAIAHRLIGSAKLSCDDWVVALSDYVGEDKEQVFAHLCGKL